MSLTHYSLTLQTLVLTVFSVLCSCHSISVDGSGVSPHLERAEKLSADGNFEEAIAEYRAHMQDRIRDLQRPTWENPHFYLLLIGDLLLAQGRVSEAEQSFLEAERAGVEIANVNDRLRTLAIYFEKHKDYRAALAVLEKYRSRDPLLFEGMADRIAKRLAYEEEHPGRSYSDALLDAP